MPHLLRNQHVALQIDLPTENYQRPRFDWTGKITSLRFKNTELLGVERTDAPLPTVGRGCYNEFGIDTPVGYADIRPGDWFQKIGIGRLQKEAGPYDFTKNYLIDPATFTVTPEAQALVLTCTAPAVNGYAYVLRKTIALRASGFVIQYELRNTGTQPIHTHEYTHNFLAIAGAPIGSDYELRFPFDLQPDQFGETVNPEEKVQLGPQSVTFTGTPREPFFFSTLSGDRAAVAEWELLHRPSRLAIRETGSFTPLRVNLWGWGHVISPELFCPIDLAAGQIATWSRTYTIREM